MTLMILEFEECRKSLLGCVSSFLTSRVAPESFRCSVCKELAAFRGLLAYKALSIKKGFQDAL